MVSVADIINRIKGLRKANRPTAFDELYVDLDIVQRHNEENEKFPHAVRVYQSFAHTPGSYANEQLRMIQYLNSRDAELHRDFIVRSDNADGRWYKEYRFLDPNIAMMFKLTFSL